MFEWKSLMSRCRQVVVGPGSQSVCTTSIHLERRQTQNIHRMQKSRMLFTQRETRQEVDEVGHFQMHHVRAPLNQEFKKDRLSVLREEYLHQRHSVV